MPTDECNALRAALVPWATMRRARHVRHRRMPLRRGLRRAMRAPTATGAACITAVVTPITMASVAARGSAQPASVAALAALAAIPADAAAAATAIGAATRVPWRCLPARHHSDLHRGRHSGVVRSRRLSRGTPGARPCRPRRRPRHFLGISEGDCAHHHGRCDRGVDGSCHAAGHLSVRFRRCSRRHCRGDRTTLSRHRTVRCAHAAATSHATSAAHRPCRGGNLHTAIGHHPSPVP